MIIGDPQVRRLDFKRRFLLSSYNFLQAEAQKLASSVDAETGKWIGVGVGIVLITLSKLIGSKLKTQYFSRHNQELMILISTYSAAVAVNLIDINLLN